MLGAVPHLSDDEAVAKMGHLADSLILGASRTGVMF